MKFLEEFAPLAGRSHLQVLAQTDSTPAGTAPAPDL